MKMCKAIRRLPDSLGPGLGTASWGALSRGGITPARTAYRWAKDPKVKAAVDARRRKAFEHSVGDSPCSDGNPRLRGLGGRQAERFPGCARFREWAHFSAAAAMLT